MSDNQQVAVFEGPRLPWHPAIADRFDGLGIDKTSWNVLVGAVYPAAKSVDSVVMALAYCKTRKLDPFKRPVHIVPMWDSQRRMEVETVWPGISELRTTAFRTGQYAGADEMEEGPKVTHDFGNGVVLTFPEWGRMTVYRNLDGVKCKFVGPKVYWLETYAKKGRSTEPNEMWKKRGNAQLEKCAEAAALRKAFPEEIGNDYAAEEMEGQAMLTPANSVPIPAQPGAPAIEAPPAPPPEEDPPPPAAKAEAPSAPPVEDAEFTETESSPAPGASDEPDDHEEAPFDAEAWLDEARDLFATCKTTADVDQAHDTLEGIRADEELGMTEAQKYQDIHEAALARVKNAAPPKRRFFIHPESNSYMTTDDGSHPPSEDGLLAEVREHEFLEFKKQADAAPDRDDPPEDSLSSHREWLLGKLNAPDTTPQGLSDLWEDTKASRARMIQAGTMTAGERKGLREEVGVIHQGLLAAAAAKATGAKPEEPPAPPPEGAPVEGLAERVAEMTERLRTMLEAAEDADAVNLVGVETFPDRARLIEEGADKVMDDLWRRMVKQRRDAVDGN